LPELAYGHCSDFIGLVGGGLRWRLVLFPLRLGVVQFWTRAIDALDFADIMQGMMKPLFSGSSWRRGLLQRTNVRGGTQGVGRCHDTGGCGVVGTIMCGHFSDQAGAVSSRELFNQIWKRRFSFAMFD